MRFDPATPSDSDLLLAWRNDPITVANSIQARPVAPEEHYAWYANTLGNPAVKIYIVREEERPIGMFRADSTTEAGAVLSWSVAPESRGLGLGKRLLAAGCTLVPQFPQIAYIKRGNEPSRRIAMAAGFFLVGEKDGLERWERVSE